MEWVVGARPRWGVVRGGWGWCFAGVWLQGSVFAAHRHLWVFEMVSGVLVLIACHDMQGNLIVAPPLQAGFLESEVLEELPELRAALATASFFDLFVTCHVGPSFDTPDFPLIVMLRTRLWRGLSRCASSWGGL